ncbi:hypothetical protein HN858_02295 [Candidatus Falkowbacteria bacterium]|jgi:hypothetical protein|nr:hypothetical protein [Candidatus Falkowbacteria bacterium]MBT5503186.1 hypothetical protein [Candidatus Falkowbacteria bacterium]MBT6574574.1 hypothetical protein [Candidatus Falkowbacteria bacterium]MBT7348486.1 hypothetical protein [Candidatus Falkowbacteria bacterium]MBT7500849.1 hypothetical protein [Candidatus Falkowbacteria bacterium]
MLNPEQSLTEKSLHANFNEVQQAHFDKIMSELEVISGGFGFADLKEKAEAGSKEALQVMRDYITKKEEIVEFIETKEMKISPENEFVEITEMKEGDRVVVMTPEGDFQPGRIETVEPVKLLAKVFLDVFNSWHTFEMASLIKIAGPVESKYENTENVGQIKEVLLELHEYKGYKVGDEFKSRSSNSDYKTRVIGFFTDLSEDPKKLCVLFEYHSAVDVSGKRKVAGLSLSAFKIGFDKIS